MTQYLILHKVRGEPAFDIAEQIQIGDEEGWIIPTSGHRAYPYRTWALDSNRFPMEGLPPEWPDHYQAVELPAKKGMGVKIDISSIIRALTPKSNFVRRF